MLNRHPYYESARDEQRLVRRESLCRYGDEQRRQLEGRRVLSSQSQSLGAPARERESVH